MIGERGEWACPRVYRPVSVDAALPGSLAEEKDSARVCGGITAFCKLRIYLIIFILGGIKHNSL